MKRPRAEVQKGMDDLENGRYAEISSDAELVAFMDESGREAEVIVRKDLDEVNRRVAARRRRKN